MKRPPNRFLLKLFFASGCLMLVLSVFGCKKNKKCVEKISVEKVFTVKQNCTYTFSDGNSEIDFCLLDINDGRAFGAECNVITYGGIAQVNLSANDDTLNFEWWGCQGDTDYSIYSNDLPSNEINGYQLKMMKMHPFSEDLNAPPESIEDYELEFVLLK